MSRMPSGLLKAPAFGARVDALVADVFEHCEARVNTHLLGELSVVNKCYVAWLGDRPTGFKANVLVELESVDAASNKPLKEQSIFSLACGYDWLGPDRGEPWQCRGGYLRLGPGLLDAPQCWSCEGRFGGLSSFRVVSIDKTTAVVSFPFPGTAVDVTLTIDTLQGAIEYRDDRTGRGVARCAVLP